MKRFQYDVTVSFAGEDRLVVERFAQVLVRAGYRVFYDAWEQHNLWGKDLYQYLDNIYRKAANYCVLFVSENYARKAWTTHELRSAQARAFEQESEYILPLRLDDTELPGLPSTTAYIDLRQHSIEEVTALLIKKFRTSEKVRPLEEYLQSADAEKRLQALTRIALDHEEDHIARVIELLKTDVDARIRERAAWALDNLRDIRAKEALLEALNDPEWRVRSNAGWALVHLGIEVFDDVRRIVEESSNSEAQEMARLVVEFLTLKAEDNESNQLAEKWLAWFREKL